MDTSSRYIVRFFKFEDAIDGLERQRRRGVRVESIVAIKAEDSWASTLVTPPPSTADENVAVLDVGSTATTWRLALMDIPDDQDGPHFRDSGFNPSNHSTYSSGGLSLGPSQDLDSRSHRRVSRASRASERESLEDEIKRTVKALRGQLDDERRRADDAERKVRELTNHLEAVNDARLMALREAGRAKEELRLYRMQLDTAQREIYRAQDVISLVDRQRHSAEKDAAQSRSKARMLNETILVQAAREEAWRMGLQEGLDRGRELVVANRQYGEEATVDDDEYSSEGSRSSSPTTRSDRRSYNEPRRRSMAAPSHRSGRSRANSNVPPPQPSPNAVPIPLPTNPPTAPQSMHPSENARPMSIRSRNVTPSRPPSAHPSENIRPMSMRNPSASGAPSIHPSENIRPVSVRYGTPSAPPSVHPSENIRPMSMRNVSPSGPPSVHPSENIRPISVRTITPTPRPHNVIIPPDNLIPTLDSDLRIRLPPPHEFIHQPDRAPSPSSGLQPAPVRIARSDTSQASQEPLPIMPRAYDQQQQPPQQQQQHKSRHRRNSSSGSSSLSQLDIVNNPYNPALRTPMSAIQEVNSAYSGSPQPRSEHGDHGVRHQRSMSQNSFQQYRPPSTHTIEDPHRRPKSRSSYAGSFQAAPADPRTTSGVSISSSTPNIQVQAPSQHSNRTDSLWGGGEYENHGPAHAASSSGSHGMPGGYSANANAYQAGPSSSPYVPVAPLQYTPRDARHRPLSRNARDDDAVSSAMSGETLTTPPERRRPLEPDWSGAVASAGHMPIQPIGSVHTRIYEPWNTAK